MPTACELTSPSQTNADEYSATTTKDATVTAMVARVSAMNATWLVIKALTTVNGAAIVIVASSFGSAIFQRGIGDSVRFASVRSSSSLPNAAAAMASTTSGAIDPASIALRTEFSYSQTVSVLASRNINTVISTGIIASTVMMISRHLPDSWRSVNR